MNIIAHLLSGEHCTRHRQWERAHNSPPQFSSVQFSSVQSLSRVRLFATPWVAARQASLSITNSRCSLRLASIESVIKSLLIPSETCQSVLFYWPFLKKKSFWFCWLSLLVIFVLLKYNLHIIKYKDDRWTFWWDFDIGYTHALSNIQNKIKSILMTTETSLVPLFSHLLSPPPTGSHLMNLCNHRIVLPLLSVKFLRLSMLHVLVICSFLLNNS